MKMRDVMPAVLVLGLSVSAVQAKTLCTVIADAGTGKRDGKTALIERDNPGQSRSVSSPQA